MLIHVPTLFRNMSLIYCRNHHTVRLTVSTPIPSDNACPPPACSNPEKTSAVDHLNVTPVYSSSLWTFCETNMTMCTWEQRDTCVSQYFICPAGFLIIKSNQVRKTKSGLSQTYKCSGFRRYGCQFQMKMEQNLNSIVLILQCSTWGSHTHSYETAAKKNGHSTTLERIYFSWI